MADRVQYKSVFGDPGLSEKMQVEYDRTTGSLAVAGQVVLLGHSIRANNLCDRSHPPGRSTGAIQGGAPASCPPGARRRRRTTDTICSKWAQVLSRDGSGPLGDPLQ